MIISIIPADKIINHLQRVTELAERVRDLLDPYGLPSDVIADCIDGALTLWGVFDEEKFGTEEEALLGILVSGVRHYWRCSTLELIVLSGDRMREWLGELNVITDKYAADLGCLTRVLPGARLGWKRELAKFGFVESKLITLECFVGEEGRRPAATD